MIFCRQVCDVIFASVTSLERGSNDAVALWLGRSVIFTDFSLELVLDRRLVFRVLVHWSELVQLKRGRYRISSSVCCFVIVIVFVFVYLPVVRWLWLVVWKRSTSLIRREAESWGILHKSSNFACRLQQNTKFIIWHIITLWYIFDCQNMHMYIL